MPEQRVLYTEVLEQAGFYRQGQPVDGLVWSAKELQPPRFLGREGRTDSPQKGGDDGPIRQRIERAFRYQAVLRPEGDQGKLGITDVYELSGSPCIYFKRLDTDLEAERLVPRLFEWQRVAWNHGQAPMVWIVTPTQVRILDAYARPPAAPGRENLERIELRRFERIADQLEELRAEVSRQEIEAGHFWRRAGRSIDRKNRVDRQLIKDLSSVAGNLGEVGLGLAEAHRLLLRAIFASYLEARGWLTSERLREAVGADRILEALRKPRTAQRLFNWLAETFNGDVFPAGRPRPYSAAQLEELRFFLQGGDPKTGQRFLWPYEFDIVPVELLSSIYEEFTHALDPAAAKSRSTHYTPMNLVELTLGEVFDDELFETDLPADAQVLDLACGSGVFLVEALRRLVSRKAAAGNRLTRKLIRDTLYKQIFGVDLSGGAVHIAAVSLYLAALELDPNPHIGNTVKFKPLVYPHDDTDKSSERRYFNLFEADAFDLGAAYNRQALFASKSFSVIVGNPPWTRPRGVRAAAGAATPEESRHVAYCGERKIQLPSQDPPDQAFVWRAADFATEGARLGFILSSRRFFSHHPDTVAARQELFGRFKPRLMVNLSNLRQDEVFPTSAHPGMIYLACNLHSPTRSTFTYVSLERLKTFKRHGTIEIGPEHVKMLSVQRAIHEEDFLKIASWGGARDARLVEELRSFAPLGKVLEQLGVVPRQGFIRGKEEERTRPVDRVLLDLPHRCLEKEGFRALDIDQERLPILKDKWMQWPRSAEIYRGPLLLVKLGLGERGMEAAWSDESVVFSRRYIGFQILTSNRGWWSCLNGILNSDLATYFVFMTSPEWGVERDNIYSEDVLRIPVPAPDDFSQLDIRQLVDIVNGLGRFLKEGLKLSHDDLAQLNNAVFDLYDLSVDQRTLVTDMVRSTVDLHRKAELSVEMSPAGPEELAAYAEAFSGVSNQYLSLRNQSKMVAEILRVPASSPLHVMRFCIIDHSASEPPLRSIQVPDLDPLLLRIAQHLPYSRRGIIHVRRHLRVYGDGELYILKPAQRRFWTRSAGLHDADAVIAEHMRSL